MTRIKAQEEQQLHAYFTDRGFVVEDVLSQR